jgi:hypothetical protein
MARSQDSELRPEAAQDIGVHSCVEARLTQRLGSAGRHGITGAPFEPILDRSRPCPLQSVEGKVSTDDVAAGLLSEVQARPA